MKALKYIIVIGIAAVVLYNSVYFTKLDEHKSSQSATEFNATVYANKFWNSNLIPNLNKSVELSTLTELLSTNPDKAFNDYSHALGIGNLRYFLIKGKGEIESVQDDNVTVIFETETKKQQIILATEYIFGNAVRDASGLININEFTNTMDFNNVSAEINKIIREQVLPPFKQKVNTGNLIEFTGAIELNKEHLTLSNIEVIPIQIKIVQ